MESYTGRANAVLVTFSTVLAICAAANYMSSFLTPQTPIGDVQLTEIFDLTVNNQLKSDQMNIQFHIKTDLTSAFQWNTKQLFVYVVCSYQTQKNKFNEVVVWDRIIEKAEDAIIDQNVVNKYPLRDQYRLLKTRNVTLQLRYRYMPIVGIMKEYFVAESSFTTPSEYFSYTGGKLADEL